MSYKLGSLFDGSGGFPRSGTLCDIEPMWAAEVEPYPIAVTKSRFPNMRHLGDISKVNGAEIEPVDIITFGSPCQDLSVAGKRAGLKHEDNGDDETTRSGLFMEAVRIIKEMRKATNGEYPRFAVWENVPGAFSSNNGEDFRVVLQELIKITEPNAVMPDVPKKGWAYADSYCGDGWSLAYRVFDAQYWGVPQRRRRIYLIADFGGQRAREILFKREGLRGHFETSRTPGQTVTSDVEGSIGADDKEGKEDAVCYGISSYDSNSMSSGNPHSGIYEADTSRTLDLNGGNPSCNQGGIAVVENMPYTLKIRGGCDVDANGKVAGKGALIQENMSATPGTSNDQYLFQPVGIDGYNADLTGDKAATLGVNCGMSTGRNGVITDTHILDDQGGSVMNIRTDGKAPTIRAQMGGHPPVVIIPDEPKAYGVTTKGNGDAFVSEERHTSLSVGGGQAGQGYPCVCYGVDAYNQTLTGDKAKTLNSAASDADHIPCTVYSVENHPADSRVNLDESGKVQTLTSRMGTGGGNVPMVMEERPRVINLNKDDVQSKTILDPKGIAPSLYAGECRGGGGECYVMEPKAIYTHPQNDTWTLENENKVQTLSASMGMGGGNTPLVMEPFCKSSRAKSADDATTWKHADVANTLNTFDQGEARANELIVEDRSTAYSFDPGASRDVGVLFLEECGKTLTNGTCPVHHDGVVISRPIHSLTTGDYMQVNEEKTATLLARDYKDPTCVEFFDTKARRYIVRRLTPTECARLQGFPDKWGHIEPKTKLTDEEYRFWLNVRKTHDAINGRAVKDYNEKQMLTYYNKLWTDSAEYKMWGNGIALCCALYVMQGIKDALDDEKIARSKWLDDLLNN